LAAQGWDTHTRDGTRIEQCLKRVQQMQTRTRSICDGGTRRKGIQQTRIKSNRCVSKGPRYQSQARAVQILTLTRCWSAAGCGARVDRCGVARMKREEMANTPRGKGAHTIEKAHHRVACNLAHPALCIHRKKTQHHPAPKSSPQTNPKRDPQTQPQPAPRGKKILEGLCSFVRWFSASKRQRQTHCCTHWFESGAEKRQLAASGT
jgi:hypothetical protein